MDGKSLPLPQCGGHTVANDSAEGKSPVFARKTKIDGIDGKSRFFEETHA
jgi:hypothetical protein